MKLHTALAAFAALTLVAACSSPFEYSTYHPKNSKSSYMPTMPSMPTVSSMKFWDSEDHKSDDGVIEAKISDNASEPIDIQAPQGRVHQ